MIKTNSVIGALISAWVASAQQPEIVKTWSTAAGENSPMIVDANGDGHMDVLVAAEDTGQIGIWLGDGEMEFRFDKQVTAGDLPSALASGDFNQDGLTDWVVANHERQHVSVLMAKQKGQFNQPKRVAVSTQPHPHVVATSDMNADGHLDLVIDNRDQFGLVVLHGDGQGDFARPGTALPVNGQPYLGFALGDINGDGLTDVVTPNSNSLSVVLNTKNGAYKVSQTISMPGAFAVALGDFNDDRQQDLVAASSNGLVRMYFGTGTGQFDVNHAKSWQSGSGAKQLITGDFNRDGIDETVMANWSGTLHWFRLSNEGELLSQALETEEIEAPWGLSGGDLNGDGKDEIVLTDGTGDQLNIYSTTK